jgi:hypothetical protein
MCIVPPPGTISATPIAYLHNTEKSRMESGISSAASCSYSLPLSQTLRAIIASACFSSKQQLQAEKVIDMISKII